MTRKPRKLCEDCGDKPAVRKQRFCKACRGSKLMEMQQAGYLEDGGRDRGRELRAPDRQQAPGSDPSPWGENAVRALEGD